MKPTKVRTFKEFVGLLRGSGLPGTKDRELLRNVYRLSRERIDKEEHGRLTAQVARRELRPYIGTLRRAQRAVDKAKKNIEQAGSICAKGTGADLFKWDDTLNEATKAVTALAASITEMEQRAMDKLHERFREPGEKVAFEPLVRDYDLTRFGWQPASTWFLHELWKYLESYFRRKRRKLRPNRIAMCSLIGTVFSAAFNEHRTDLSVKMALYRNRCVSTRITTE